MTTQQLRWYGVPEGEAQEMMDAFLFVKWGPVLTDALKYCVERLDYDLASRGQYYWVRGLIEIIENGRSH